MAIVLDAGGLIAIDRMNRRVGAMLRIAQLERIPVRSSAAVVAQAWHDGRSQVNLARALTGIDVAAIDETTGRRIGQLLARTSATDVVDGHIALLTDPGDVVLTTDVGDIQRLLEARDVQAVLDRV
jgi:hypothetical protein